MIEDRVLMFLNGAHIYWFSKKQNFVESSSFGSEFIALKQSCEYIPDSALKMNSQSIAYHFVREGSATSGGQRT
jgi:hypothetical protein